MTEVAIGELYDANNVVVGQAAVLFAPENTPLPDFGTLTLDDPFDLAPWFSYTLTVASGVTAYTLTDGQGNTTSSLSHSDTHITIQAALDALDNGVDYTVTGSASPYTITMDEYDTLTASAFTGGVGSLTGGLWTPCGATDQGWKYGTNKNTQAIQIEEQSTPVGMTITTQSVTLEGSLDEDISRTLTLAYNGVLSVNAATSDEPGYDDITLTDLISYYAVVLLTSNAEGFPRIVYAPKWSQLSNVSTTFRRAADKRMYPVSFATLCKPSQIQVINITEAPTA